MTPFIVAEMSANHLQSLTRALAIVDAAADAGANAIKAQTWRADTMCIDPGYVLMHGPWMGKRLVDLYREAWLPWEWHRPIFDRARERGLIPFSAAFDRDSVDFLETVGVDRHKVASFELTDLPLIRYMAGKGKPMILSTGMATWPEIMQAIGAATPGPAVFDRLTVLKCTSAYPASPAAMNLRTLAALQSMERGYGGLKYGLSDHSMGNDAAVVATALGATYIEKHLTLSRADGGPDAGFSLEPHEFADMVQAVRRAAQCLGEVKYGPQPGEDPTLRRGLWIARDVHEGEALRLNDNVVTARPGIGLPASHDITGKRAARSLKARTPLLTEDIA